MVLTTPTLRSMRPTLATVSRRFFGQAAAAPSSADGAQTTVLSNGVTVVSQAHSSPISRVAVTFGAGIRNESGTDAGVCHYLRNTAFASTKNRTALRITREAELNGRQYSATCDREQVSLAVDFVSGDLDAVASLADCATSPALLPWEIRAQDQRFSLDMQLAANCLEMGALDEAHRVAFRNTGLGQRVIVPLSRASSITPEVIAEYRRKFFVGGNTVVSGYGIDHSQLVEAVSSLEGLSGGKAPISASQYFGGQSLVPADADVTHTILAFQAPSVSSPDALKFHLLRFILGGNGTSLKWSTDATASRVGEAAASAAKDAFKVNGFASLYADNGLVGVHAVTSAADTRDVMSAVAGTVKSILSGDVSEEDLNRAKAQLNMDILSRTRAAAVADAASQVLASGSFADADAMANKVNAVTLADIKQAAAGVLKSRPVLAARGAIDHSPYLEDLQL